MTPRGGLPPLLPAAFLGVGAVVAALLLRLLVAPRFVGLFADFGGELPWLTRLFLTRWVGPASSLVGAVAVIAVGRRSFVGGIVAGCALIVATVSVFLVAMYLPIFALAGRIR
ncbi:MAG: hypothetical protein MUC96_04820 [Myxococcaceae bacterium]|nr:hypothetical protein [Myxococcaceae bacterium]